RFLGLAHAAFDIGGRIGDIRLFRGRVACRNGFLGCGGTRKKSAFAGAAGEYRGADQKGDQGRVETRQRSPGFDPSPAWPPSVNKPLNMLAYIKRIGESFCAQNVGIGWAQS